MCGSCTSKRCCSPDLTARTCPHITQLIGYFTHLLCISHARTLDAGIGGELRKAYAELFDVNLLEMLNSGNTPGARSGSQQRSQEGSQVEAGLKGSPNARSSAASGGGLRSSFRVMSARGGAATGASESTPAGAATPPLGSPTSASSAEPRASSAEVRIPVLAEV